MEDFLKNKSIGKTIQNADFFTALRKIFISRPENRRPSFVNLFCSNSIRQAVISGVLLSVHWPAVENDPCSITNHSLAAEIGKNLVTMIGNN